MSLVPCPAKPPPLVARRPARRGRRGRPLRRRRRSRRALRPTFAVAADSQTFAGPASFADVVDRVKSSVVSVKVKMADDGDAEFRNGGHAAFPAGQPLRPLLQAVRPARRQRRRRPCRAVTGTLTMAQGSGFFISADGYVVTNNHVVDHADRSDGHHRRRQDARRQGDRHRPEDRPRAAQDRRTRRPIPSSSSPRTTPRVGDWVIAVGNPFGLGGTVTAGIVSARGRDIGSGPYDDFLQIDAPVNHGNSGGPTFNIDGDVVGVNTAIFSPSGGSVGIGFAIASDVVQERRRAAQGQRRGRARLARRRDPAGDARLADSLGVEERHRRAGRQGDRRTRPAASAGVKIGDVITAVNGQTVADPRDLARRIAASGPKKSPS